MSNAPNNRESTTIGKFNNSAIVQGSWNGKILSSTFLNPIHLVLRSSWTVSSSRAHNSSTKCNRKVYFKDQKKKENCKAKMVAFIFLDTYVYPNKEPCLAFIFNYEQIVISLSCRKVKEKICSNVCFCPNTDYRMQIDVLERKKQSIYFKILHAVE